MTSKEYIQELQETIADLESWVDEQSALCQLAALIFNDKLSRLDFVYLVTETPDNALSGIDRAAAISRQNRYYRTEREKITPIGIGGFIHPACDHPDLMEEKLRYVGVFSEEIVRVNYKDAPVGPNGLHHTGTETAMVARFALENNYKTVGLIAPPFHQLRSYMHLLTAFHRVGRSGQSIKVFNCAGSPQNWRQEVVHSQGEIKASRFALLRREIENCLKYWKQGYLISPAEALKCFVLHRS